MQNLNPDILIGKLTAQENYVLNGNTLTGDKVLRTMFYNDFGQMTAELGSNHYPNSRLWKRFDYDFADNLIRQRRQFHTVDLFREHRDTLNNTYDHQGRVIDNYHSMRDNTRQHISRLAYTAKDEVKTKFLGGTLSGFLQEVNFEYLDNGFLTGINPIMSATDLFQLNINYDQAVTGLTGDAQKNGNISQLSWKVQGKTEQTYGYSYDFQDRLKVANYGVYGTPARSTLVIGNEYSTTYSYDPRGNITSITRNGMVDTGNGYEDMQIDNLTLQPHAGTNRLKSVTDAAPCPDKKAIHQALDNTELHATNQTIEADNAVNLGANVTYQAGTSVTLKAGFHAEAGTNFVAKIDGCGQTGSYETGGFVQRSAADIEYDAEGNMIKDPNKGIDILFDYNNRPYKVAWANGNTVEWLYDGAGTKLQKNVKRNEVTAPLYKQDYFDGIEFRNDTLEAIYLNDAKITHDNGNFDYIFYGKDHLENSRVLFKDNGGIAQLVSEHHFYPFGIQFDGDFTVDKSTKQLFNFKEFNNDFGLGWSDFGFRFYLGDSGIPRFLNVDPISHQFPHVSTYNYAENKPINSIDLHGLQAWEVNLSTRRGKHRTPSKKSPLDNSGEIATAITEVGVGFTPAGVLLDVRDLKQAAEVGSGAGVILATIGLIPGVGDAAKAIGKGIRNFFVDARKSFNRIDEFGGGTGTTAREIAEKSAESLRNEKRHPTMTSAALDRTTGEFFEDVSGKPHPRSIHPILKGNMADLPEGGLEFWDICNCAEFKAVNQALNSGSKMKDLEVHTVRVSTGQAAKRCRNCEVTTKGTNVTSDN